MGTFEAVLSDSELSANRASRSQQTRAQKSNAARLRSRTGALKTAVGNYREIQGTRERYCFVAAEISARKIEVENRSQQLGTIREIDGRGSPIDLASRSTHMTRDCTATVDRPRGTVRTGKR